jgi:lambda family phage portal protein
VSVIDKIIEKISPNWALKREKAKADINRLKFQTMAQDAAYKGASRSIRSMMGYNPFRFSPTQEHSYFERVTSSARSNDLYRNTTVAGAIVDRSVNQITGAGLRLKAKLNFKVLDISEDEAIEKAERIEQEFSVWANDENSCDFERVSNFKELQTIALYTCFLDGDTFATTPYKKRPGSVYGLKIQNISGERVSNPNHITDTDTLKSGITLDSDGSPTHINVLAAHPCDTFTGKRYKWSKLSIFSDDGLSRRIQHVFTKKKPGQTRSLPLLAPVIEPIKQLDRINEAEIMRHVIGGMFTGFIYSEGDKFQDEDLYTNTPTIEDVPGSEIAMGAGVIAELKPGEKITFADPTKINSNYEVFVNLIIKLIAARIGIPFEELILVYNKSYSAARAAVLQAWKWYSQRRIWFADRYCNPIYRLWFDEAVAIGRIEAPGYNDPFKRLAWTNAIWLGPAKGAINELDEIKATKEKIATGVTTLDFEAAQNGFDYWSEIHPERKREVRRRLEDGIEVINFSDRLVDFNGKSINAAADGGVENGNT